MKKFISILAVAIMMVTTCFAATAKTVQTYYIEKRPVLERYEEMLAVAQSGYKVGGKYFTINEDKEKTGLDLSKIQNPDGWGGDITTCVKFIFAALSSGKTPAEFANFDVVKYLTDKQSEDGSFNPFIYTHCMAMFALDAAGAQYDKQKAVQFILDAQFDNGAWGYSDFTTGEPVNDADTTAMAITAMAGKTVTGVSDSVTAAINFFKTAMQADGGFITYGMDSSNTAACVLLALVDAGVDIDNSEFSKIPAKLEQFKNTDGSYKAYLDDDDEIDLSATSQIFLALEAYKNGKSAYKLLSAGDSFTFILENPPVQEESSSVNSNTQSTSNTQSAQNEIPKTDDIFFLLGGVLLLSAFSFMFLYKKAHN